jgi:hypothetical protein
MFIGHFAVAFGAKRVAPELSLGTLFLAAQLADLLWPTFVLLGLEHFEVRPGATAVTPLEFISYPYSHSLLALTCWAAVVGVCWLAVRRLVSDPRRATARAGRAAATIAVLVLSHWLLDAATHKADMPLAFGDQRVGLGLWQSVPATMIVEGVMFVAGVGLYARATRPRDRTGAIALWSLTAFLVVVYCGNVFGPPPPSVKAVAWSAQAIWLLVVWAYWVDRHRVGRRSREASAGPAAAVGGMV